MPGRKKDETFRNLPSQEQTFGRTIKTPKADPVQNPAPSSIEEKELTPDQLVEHYQKVNNKERFVAGNPAEEAKRADKEARENLGAGNKKKFNKDAAASAAAKDAAAMAGFKLTRDRKGREILSEGNLLTHRNLVLFEDTATGTKITVMHGPLGKVLSLGQKQINALMAGVHQKIREGKFDKNKAFTVRGGSKASRRKINTRLLQDEMKLKVNISHESNKFCRSILKTELNRTRSIAGLIEGKKEAVDATVDVLSRVTLPDKFDLNKFLKEQQHGDRIIDPEVRDKIVNQVNEIRGKVLPEKVKAVNNGERVDVSKNGNVFSKTLIKRLLPAALLKPEPANKKVIESAAKRLNQVTFDNDFDLQKGLSEAGVSADNRAGIMETMNRAGQRNQSGQNPANNRDREEPLTQDARSESDSGLSPAEMAERESRGQQQDSFASASPGQKVDPRRAAYDSESTYDEYRYKPETSTYGDDKPAAGSAPRPEPTSWY